MTGKKDSKKDGNQGKKGKENPTKKGQEGRKEGRKERKIWKGRKAANYPLTPLLLPCPGSRPSWGGPHHCSSSSLSDHHGPHLQRSALLRDVSAQLPGPPQPRRCQSGVAHLCTADPRRLLRTTQALPVLRLHP